MIKPDSTKKPLKYIPFYAKDYLTSEMHSKLDWPRRGMYLEALLHAHLNDGIPADRTHFRNMLGAGVTDEDLDAILAPFQEHESKPGYLQHPKTAEVLAEQSKVIQKATAANKARWDAVKANTTRPEQTTTPTTPQTSEPVTVSEPDKAVLTQLFAALKAHYPNVIGAAAAEQVFWQKVAEGRITAANAEDVRDGLRRWKTSKQWRKDGGQFILGFTRWIEEERWLDKPAQDKTTAPPAASSSGRDPMAIYIPPKD